MGITKQPVQASFAQKIEVSILAEGDFGRGMFHQLFDTAQMGLKLWDVGTYHPYTGPVVLHSSRKPAKPATLPNTPIQKSLANPSSKLQ
jgi:hypothetical protein